MKIYFLSLLFTLFSFTYLKISTIGLWSGYDIYFVYVFVEGNGKRYPLAIDSSIPYSIIPSVNCTKCHYHLQEDDKEGIWSLIEENITYTKDGLDFTGNLYETSYMFEDDFTRQNTFDFLLYDNITYAKEVNDPGKISISFANKYFKDKFKYLSLCLTGDIREAYIGDEIDTKVVKNVNSLRNFTVQFDNSGEYPKWYLGANSLKIKNGAGENTFGEQKLTFDTTSWVFKIPKKFFYDNLNKIVNEELECQYNYDGVFECSCGSDFEEEFPTFTFDIGGQKLEVFPTDIMSYDGSSTCYVYLGINYENDYFIGGLNVLNNYYSIFNYEENKLMIYDYESQQDRIRTITPIVFVVVAVVSAGIFVLIYLGYKKYMQSIPREDLRQAHEGQFHEN